jgi:predicted metal-binding membrane protein
VDGEKEETCVPQIILLLKKVHGNPPSNDKLLNSQLRLVKGRHEPAAYLIALLVFSAAAAITRYFSSTMAGNMAMPGGWNMSMTWMPMGGWMESTLMFAAMWAAMMIAMMLPSTLPMVMLYFRAVRVQPNAHAGALSFLMTTGYFGVWTAFGILAYIAGRGIAILAMHSDAFSRAMPIVSGIALIGAGLYQFSQWKANCLRYCRDFPHSGKLGSPIGALRFGVRHAAFCAACCWALMLIQMVLGVMNIMVMIGVVLVIALEKLLKPGIIVARVAGTLAMAAGGMIMIRAVLA